jgi:hypothetical protein
MNIAEKKDGEGLRQRQDFDERQFFDAPADAKSLKTRTAGIGLRGAIPVAWLLSP